MTTRIGWNPDIQRKQQYEESAQRKQMFEGDDPFQIDKWYEACKDHTFETKLIPLTIEQAKAIKFMCHYFKLYKEHELETKQKKGLGITLNYDQNLLQQSLDENNSDLSYCWGESFNWKALTAKSSEQYVIPLKQLEKSINDVMDELKCVNGIFIRLNTRSPKDSAIEGMKTFQLLFKELKEWDKTNRINDETKSDDKTGFNLKNDQICSSFYRAAIKSLSVENGYEAIELLTRSYQRIFTDLNLAMLKQGEENLKLYCTIRKWYDIVDPIWEFRLIVKNYKPTALTQYHKTIIIPNGYKHKTFFEKRILAEFDIIKDKLDKKLRDYTIDFAVVLKNKDIQNIPIDIDSKENKYNDDDDDDDDNDPIDKVYLIEINHEPPLAGTALFDFKNVEDKKILDGEKPFEFRIYESKKDIDYSTLDNILPDNTIDFVKVLKGENEKKKETNQQEKGLFDYCVLL